MREKRNKRGRLVSLLLGAVMTVSAAAAVPAFAATGVNVTSHSIAEIRSKIGSIPINQIAATAVTPSVTPPYAAGSLSDATLNSALDTINAVRYVAGLDSVSLSSEYNEDAQAAALVNAANKESSHKPIQPSEMSEELYNQGKNAAGSSNLSWNSQSMSKVSLNRTILGGWMNDGADGTVSTLGHRRWVINPKMSQTGFGMVESDGKGTYGAMYAFDSGNSSAAQTGVVWPAQNMPAEYMVDVLGYYRYGYPWSYSYGSALTGTVTVTMVRAGDNKTWKFSDSDSSDGFFAVENSYYGQMGCVIFRPNDLAKYTPEDYVGQSYHITITHDGSTLADYTVNFFGLTALSSYSLSSTSVSGKSNETVKVTAGNASPSNALTTYSWQIEDESIASISSVSGTGVTVTLKKCGTTTLTAVSSNDSIVRKCTITVDHTPGDAATCTTSQVCTVCATELEPATGHKWGEWVKDKDNENNHIHTCENDASHTETAAHTWDTGSETTKPTCEEDGVTTFTCDDCGEKRTESIESLGHDWGDWEKLDDEKHQHICRNDREHVETVAHSYDAGKVTQEAVCEAEGIKTYKCALCSGTKTESIPELKHSWGDWTLNADGETHTRICNNDKAHTESGAHTWNDGVVTMPAFCTDDGIRLYTCTYGCGATKTESIPKLGHFWQSWVSDGKSGHTRICKYNAAHTETAGHVWNDGVITTQATCTTDGVRTYTCTDCGETKIETIEKTGHKWGSWVQVNENHQHTCDNDSTHVETEAHSYGEGTVTKTAACAEDGTTTYTCSICSGIKEVSIPAPGHNWGSWMQNEDGKTHTHICQTNEEHTETKDHSWQLVKGTETPATCTTDGGGKYRCADDCGAEKTEIIRATGHTVVTDEAKAATCTETGLTEGSHCSVCNEVIVRQEVTAKLAHTVVTDAAKVATCTETGLTEGSHCSVCNEVIVRQEVTEMLAHTVVADTAKAATCTQTGLTEGSHCSVCGTVIKAQEVTAKLAHTVVTDAAKAATCTEAGLTEGSHCSVCGTVIKKQSSIPALGHSWGSWTQKADGSAHTRTCSNNSSHVETQEHTWQLSETSEANCTTDGTRSYVCTVCGGKKSETSKAPGHTVVVDAAKAATCTETGLTEGSHCSVCGTVVKKQESVPALGHSFDDGTVTKAATESATGVRTYTCKTCSTKKTESIAKLPAAVSALKPQDAPSLSTSEASLLKSKKDEAPSGASFSLLQLRFTKSANTSISLKWTKVKGASGYVIYGNQCGKTYKKLATIKSGSKTTWTQKKLKKGKYYKYYIVATANYKGTQKVIASSKTIHVATAGGKVGNYKSVKLTNVKKNTISLKRKKTFKIKASEVAASKKLTVKRHRKIAYETSDKTIATVSKTGVVKGIAKGTCYIYVYTQSGTFSKIKVKVS